MNKQSWKQFIGLLEKQSYKAAPKDVSIRCYAGVDWGRLHFRNISSVERTDQPQAWSGFCKSCEGERHELTLSFDNDSTGGEKSDAKSTFEEDYDATF